VLFQRTFAAPWLTRISPYMRSVLVAVSTWLRQSDVFRPEKVVPISQCPVCGSNEEEKRAEGLEEDEAAADAQGYGFGAGGGAEFAEDGGYVKFGGVVGDVEAGGDLLVGQARS
jgi:hypothetical protein